MVTPAKPPLARRSSSGTKVREGGQLEAKPRYREKSRNCGLFVEYVRLVWRCHFADGTDVRAIPLLEEQDALAKSACLNTSVAMAEAEDPLERFCSSPAGSSNEEDCKMGSLVEAEAEELVGIKPRLRQLQELCRAKRRMVPKSASKAAVLALELVDDVVVVSTPGADNVVDARTDKSTRQLPSTKAKATFFHGKVARLKRGPR